MIWFLIIVGIIVGLAVGHFFGKRQGFIEGYQAYDIWNVEILEDELPKKTSRKNLAMKMQNEIMKYLYVEDEKVKLKVVKSEEDPEAENIIEYVETVPNEYDENPAKNET